MENYPRAWLSGPVSDKELRPPHDRSIFAIATQNELAVTASADHGLRVWDTNRGSHLRQLYNKNFGHQEWVSCCAFLQDNRILSGSMDGSLCLWDRRVVRCENLNQHQASISKVATDENDIGISASYDKTLIVWDLHRISTLQRMQCSGPVMDFAWHNSLIAAGDRQGQLTLWDINTGNNIQSAVPHNGAIHKICLSSDGGEMNFIASAGGKDGKVAITDMRTSSPVFNTQVHGGAINFISPSLSNTLVTGSSDKSVNVLDAFMNFRVRSKMNAPGQILCGELFENLVAVGCSDGNVIVFNTDTEEATFGFGADNQGGINCLATTPGRRKLITGGDSGVPLLISFV